MDLEQFLKKLITDKAPYVLTDDDKKVIQFEGIATFIFRKLNSSKYKASASPKDFDGKVKDKINLCIDHNLPIHISFPFGATKNPYLPTAPGIDWAEVMNIAFIREYLKPIAAAYKYGVVLEYVSVATFEEKVNRIPPKDVDLYDKQFSELVEYYKDFLPNNLELKFTRVSDLIPQKETNRLIELKVSQLKRLWNQTPQEVKERKLIRAKRNCLIDKGETKVDQVLLESALGHDAFCSECWTHDVAPWDKKDMITLGNNFTAGWAIHVRSTPGSSVNFWSGVGAFLRRGKQYIPTVLSISQYEKVKTDIEEVKTSILPPGLGKNLTKILVVKKN